ncbi:hypothetical protein BZA77DRAFT_346013 [Pyronema omphalodes]|nr:hypothetical protein BZA77DRAFT_346013 [Pyronema omphalodes]
MSHLAPYLLSPSISKSTVHRPPSTVFLLWSLVFGLWSLVFGLWSLVFGLWSLVFGLWNSGAGAGMVLAGDEGLYGSTSSTSSTQQQQQQQQQQFQAPTHPPIERLLIYLPRLPTRATYAGYLLAGYRRFYVLVT